MPLIRQPVGYHIGAHGSIPDDTSPNTEAQANLITTFTDSIKIISYLEVTVVGVQHNLTRKIRFVCPHTIVQTELIRSALMS
jgi:hypothetical protein